MVGCNDFYQVSCTVVDCGRNLPKSKRCIRWKFGIINKEAVANGANGIECKGQEHEVMLLWSVTSGKRLVQQDGKQVHFSKGKRTDGKFQVQWSDEDLGLEYVVIAHAAPPIRAKENWKQFDLRCNGKSFHDMVAVCSLGIVSCPETNTSVKSDSVAVTKLKEGSITSTTTNEAPDLDTTSEADSIPNAGSFKKEVDEQKIPAVEEDDEVSKSEEEFTTPLSGGLPVVEEDTDDVESTSEKSPSFKDGEEFSVHEDDDDDDGDDDNESGEDYDDSGEDYDESGEDYDEYGEDDDSITSCLFESNWSDVDDEINPSEPPSFEAIERGNAEAKKKDPLSYEQVWGKLDPSGMAKKNPFQKSPSSVKDYEGYFKPKKSRSFSPLRKIDLTNLSKKSLGSRDRSYSEV